MYYVHYMAQVLIIEDDSFISLFLERKLKEVGHIVYTAGKTSEADSILVKQHNISIILLDLILPDESGFDFLARIKKPESPHKDIPVLILSNLGQEEEVARGKKLGAVDFLVKGNLSPNEIAERVQVVLSEQAK